MEELRIVINEGKAKVNTEVSPVSDEFKEGFCEMSR
jgi:hypothetical protein